MPECYIRGSTIKYLRIPDEVIENYKEDSSLNRRQDGSGRGRGGSAQRGGGAGRSGPGGPNRRNANSANLNNAGSTGNLANRPAKQQRK